MRGLSLVGLLVGLGIVSMLVVNQLKPSRETGESAPTEAIDKANEAVDIMEQENDDAQRLNDTVEQLEKDVDESPAE